MKRSLTLWVGWNQPDLRQVLGKEHGQRRGSKTKEPIYCFLLGIWQCRRSDSRPMSSIPWCAKIPRLLSWNEKETLLPVVNWGRSTSKKMMSFRREAYHHPISVGCSFSIKQAQRRSEVGSTLRRRQCVKKLKIDGQKFDTKLQKLILYKFKNSMTKK